MKIGYSKIIENQMILYYQSLSEKNKRLYVWMEVSKLWYWWITYLKKLFKCSKDTISKWKRELESWEKIQKGVSISRKKWWWRKDLLKIYPELIDTFNEIIQNYTAWSAVDPNIQWTNLTNKDIIEKFDEDYDIKISIHHVRGLIIKRWLKKRKFMKWKTFKSVEWRNEQFENIAMLQKEYKEQWNPVMSIDVKKKN
jgi:hypothetical protein